MKRINTGNLRNLVILVPIVVFLLVVAPGGTAPALAQETVVFQAQSNQPIFVSAECPEGVEGVCFNFEASGAANIMGPVSWTINVVQESLPPPCTNVTSEITLVGATGTITLSTSEVVCPGPTPFGFPFLSSGDWEITGGTGEFSGITGSGTGRAVILPNGKNTVHFSGSVSY